jgi:hypothetical protein
MVSGVSGSSPIDFTPTDAADIPAASAQAKVQVAVLKNQQDMMRLEGQTIARMLEPNKGANLDAYA